MSSMTCSNPTLARKEKIGDSFVYEIDPTIDRRWDEFVRCHPRGSVFHSPAWLRALSRTYGYRPVVYTTAAPDDEVLENGLVLCEVKSWISGRRLVSLPFSDHCEVLADTQEELDLFSRALEK